MGVVIPLRLRQKADFTDQAKEQIAALEPAHQRRIYVKLAKLAERGIKSFLDASPLKMVFRAERHVIRYLAVIVEETIVAIRILKDQLTVFAVVEPARTHATLSARPNVIFNQQHHGNDHSFTIIGVINYVEICFFWQGYVRYTAPERALSLPLVIEKAS